MTRRKIGGTFCLSLVMLLSLVMSCTHQPQSIVERHPVADTKEEMIRAFLDAQKLSSEAKYDEALVRAYKAQRLAREMHNTMLEMFASNTIGNIYWKIGDNFVGSKIMTESAFIKQFEMIDSIGFKGYFRETASFTMDLLEVDEEYIFYFLQSDQMLSYVMEPIRQLTELTEMSKSDDAPEKVKKIWPDLQELQKSAIEMAQALDKKNLQMLKRSSIKLFDLLEKIIPVAMEDEEETTAFVKGFIKSYRTYLKAFFDKDRKRALSAIDGIFEPFESMIKKETGVGFEEQIRTQLTSKISDLRQKLENEGREIFTQLFASLSSRSVLNNYLLHFMRVHKDIEPIFKKYSYITISDLEPYGEDILWAAASVRKNTEADGTIDLSKLPVVLFSADFSLSDNLLAISSGLTPEGQWLYTGNPARLLTAKDEVAGLLDERKKLAKLTGVNAEYAQGHLLLRQAIVHYDAGNMRDSLSALQLALETFVRRADDERVWQIQFMMGLEYHKEGNTLQAIKFFKEAVSTIEKMRSSFRSENIKALVIDDKIFVYEFLIDLLIKAHSNAEALSYIEKAKARVLLDRLSSPKAKIAFHPRMINITKAQSALREIDRFQEIKHRREDKLESDALENLNRNINKKYEEYLSYLEEMRYSNPEYASLISGEIVSLDEIQNAIDNETVVLEYFIGAQKVFILVVHKQGPVEAFVTEIKYQKLQEMIKRFREDIAVEGSRDPTILAKELHNIFIGPVEQRIQGKRLCIVPHEVAHFLPFHALMKGNRYLIQDHQIFYSPSSSALKYALHKRKEAKSTILVVGNPDGTLEGAAEEARQVASLVPQSKVLLGKEATKQQVIDAVRTVDMAHFATHGELDKENPLLSYLRLADGAQLTVADIYGLDLKANLVTLSACDTHLGKLTNGDEIIGLTRTFMVAGVPSIVASLWRVEDRSTTALMGAFYRKFIKEGTTKVEALRQAQLEMIGVSGKYAHPKRWAPFILVGAFQ